MLSTNDYTTEEKEKLASIEAGANKTVIDIELSDMSENPVQNKVIKSKFDNVNSAIEEVRAEIPESELFIAEYGVTTNAEIYAAHQAGKVCVFFGDNGPTQPKVRIFYAMEVTETSATFFYMRSNQVVQFRVQNDQWSQYAYFTVAKKNDIPTDEHISSLVESYAQPKGNYLTGVNGVEADENGNVEIDIPEHTWESLPDKPFGHFDNKILVSEQYVQHQGVIIAESLPLNGSYINFTIDDVTYSADYNSNNTSYFGNVNLVNMWGEDTGEDYCIWIGEENGVPTYKFYFADTTSDKKVQIEQMEMYLQLDEVWIPPSIARVYDHTWESLPDKPFYNGTREEWLFHITDTSNYSLGDVVNTGDNTEIIVGETYYPYVNGTTCYEVVAVMDEEYNIPCIPISYADGNCIMKVYHDVNLEFEWRFGVLNHVKFVSGYVPDEVGVYRQEYVLKQLDEEYIPDTIARTSDIPEVPVQSVNGMTGDVIIEIPTLDSLGAQPAGDYALKSDILSPVQADLSQTDTESLDYVKGVIRQESLPDGYPYAERYDIERVLAIDPSIQFAEQQFPDGVTVKQTNMSVYEVSGSADIIGCSGEWIQFYDADSPNGVHESALELIDDNTLKAEYGAAWLKYDLSTNIVTFSVDVGMYDGLPKRYAEYSYLKDVFPMSEEFLPTEVAHVSTAQVGQTIVVKSVDEAGKITEWEAQSLPEGLPSVTADNNGAFLRVVDGAWAVAAIPNAEEAEF